MYPRPMYQRFHARFRDARRSILQRLLRVSIIWFYLEIMLDRNQSIEAKLDLYIRDIFLFLFCRPTGGKASDISDISISEK